jgi:hypothetical protein
MANTLYCSNRCCQEAYRERKREKKAVAGDGVQPVAGDGSGEDRKPD